jgi:hypothetical protein
VKKRSCFRDIQPNWGKYIRDTTPFQVAASRVHCQYRNIANG